MTRDHGTRLRAVAPQRAMSPAVEPLESRQLLSGFYTGFSANRPVITPGGIYQLAMSGPGFLKVTHLKGGTVGVVLFGTTGASTLTVTQTYQRPHKSASSLDISSLKINSGVIGAIDAGSAELNGTMTPLSGVNLLQFGTIGPNAQIDVNSGIQRLSAGAVTLGPTGHVRIAGDVTQSLNVGALAIDGGSFIVGHDVTGTMTAGNVTLSDGGSFTVGHNLSGGAQVNGNLAISGNSAFTVGNDLGGLSVSQAATIDTGGQLTVGEDLTGPLNIGSGLTIGSAAELKIQRDVTSTGITVGGDVNLAGGSIDIGRNLSGGAQINGNLIVTTGGGFTVGGELDNLTIGGALEGNGTTTPDLTVGLDLSNLVVNGGAADQGGIEHASIDVAKSIIGLTVPHGIFNSLITAGVSITGSNVGADGPDAVYNSDIRAVVSILNVTFNGNVRSTFATNPNNSTGYPTRIEAGENRAGVFTAGGLIDNFEITGALIDSVVAASVQPSGGNGTLPVVGYGAAYPTPTNTPGDKGSNTYDSPAGTTTVTLNGSSTPTTFPNWTEITYAPGQPPVATYDTNPSSPYYDPMIDDFIFPGGAINPSLTVSNGLPSRSTVLGGVISTANHGDSADFAGLFAADTSGVFVGAEPTGS
jgi:hypothetical protein